ncbi:hypothetical protein E2562_022054 [Oryza meyeriana var. granulata]|uniref:Uncharacterized protein n=1 Tax=Oryza meyeriana var. granulata TaxID=110450 RepID=A0A6G1ENP1_9ORYZ|nr:hypothetical protein E2562_022054 [Oryza meyeriana var. granulata]
MLPEFLLVAFFIVSGLVFIAIDWERAKSGLDKVAPAIFPTSGVLVARATVSSFAAGDGSSPGS